MYFSKDADSVPPPSNHPGSTGAGPRQYMRQGSRPSPHGKEMQKSKMAVWGGLTNSCEKKRSKKQRRKGKIYASECRVPKNSKER